MAGGVTVGDEWLSWNGGNSGGAGGTSGLNRNNGALTPVATLE